MNTISGFSKLSKEEKINWLAAQISYAYNFDVNSLKHFWHRDEKLQKTFDEFSENTISNFYFPYGIAPNFKVNDEIFHVPMVIEESSVVAAASKSAKFWLDRGGFKAEVVATSKSGQVHFLSELETGTLETFFNERKDALINACSDLTFNMQKRGGGITNLELKNKTAHLQNYYQLDVSFETCDAMGANFINSVLERLARTFQEFCHHRFKQGSIEIIMSILTNYTPECRVRAWVDCPIEQLSGIDEKMSGGEFAHKFEQAVTIAKVDVNRAVTHNKGIMNGIDALVLATGNDFRAVEACAHAYAARDGSYRSLSSCKVVDGHFHFELELPLALGCVGGLTSLHPMACASLGLLGRPNAKKLMKIAAAVGLAQNFGAVRSLVTTGIQQGHMKMHLLNILNQLGASEEEIILSKTYFESKAVSFSAVREYLEKMKQSH